MIMLLCYSGYHVRSSGFPKKLRGPNASVIVNKSVWNLWYDKVRLQYDTDSEFRDRS